MGRSTGIAWTRSTRNFWSGCTKVGPGCDGCYAEAFNRFTRGKSEASGQAVNWGPGAPRIPHLEGAAKDLRRWNGICAYERETGRVVEKDWQAGWKRAGFWPVFLNSHSDFFDNEVPDEWRWHAYPVIAEVTNLEIFLVTKRVGNVAKMVPERWMREGFPAHVRLIVTAVNQEEADRDIPKLLELPCRNGVSYEPAIGPINWKVTWLPVPIGDGPERMHGLEWIIIGGESDQAGHETRPFDLKWAQMTIAQCRDAGVAVFVKQIGSKPISRQGSAGVGKFDVGWPIKDRAGADPAEWPADLRVQEFPA